MKDERHTLVARRAGAWLLPLALFAYLFAPGHPSALLTGLPLDLAGLACAAGLAIALFGLGLPSLGRRTTVLTTVALLLVALKLALWSLAPVYGLAASYYSRPRLGGTPERSTEWRAAAYTRVEPSPGQPGFATYFFNDVERFNFYEQGQPDRRGLPFAVRWDGFLHVPADGRYPFTLAADGTAILSLDGQPTLTLGGAGAPAAGVREDSAFLTLARGAHPIRVEYIHPGGAAPALRLAWDPGDGSRLLAPPFLTVEPADGAWLARDVLVGWAARGPDAGFLVLLATFVILSALPLVMAAGRGFERPLLALFLLSVLLHALLTTGDLYRRTVILEGGQDWLTYESYARDILLDGPLMTLGKPLGEGKPFFFQPFYPYYLAGLHWLTGEDLWGPVVLQLLGLGVCGVLLYELARRLFGTRAAWATLALFLVLRATQLDWVARKLLSENLYFLLLPAAILSLIRFLDARRRRDLVLAGLLLGLAAITRAPTLLYVPLAAGLTALVLRREGATRRSALAAATILLAVTAGVAALVPLRNYVVSGRPALVATNGGATLLLAHPPSPRVRLARVDQDPVYNWLRLDRPTREVVEFVRQDPAGYLATLVPLGLYSLGFSGAIDGTGEVAPEILALTGLYLASLVLLPAARAPRAWLLHLFVAVHLAIMMTFLPYVYGYRQVLPMQLLMLVVAGGLLGQQRPSQEARAVEQHVDRVTSPTLDKQLAGLVERGEADSHQHRREQRPARSEPELSR